MHPSQSSISKQGNGRFPARSVLELLLQKHVTDNHVWAWTKKNKKAEGLAPLQWHIHQEFHKQRADSGAKISNDLVTKVNVLQVHLALARQSNQNELTRNVLRLGALRTRGHLEPRSDSFSELHVQVGKHERRRRVQTFQRKPCCQLR